MTWQRGNRIYQVHMSVLLGALLAAMSLSPARDALLAFALVVGIHLAGHALLCWHYRLGISRICVHGLGGDVAPRQHQRPGAMFAIGLGGIIAQLLLAIALTTLEWSAEGSAGVDMVQRINTLVLLANLLPFRGSDARLLWTLLNAHVAWQNDQHIQTEQRRWQSILAAEQARGALPAQTRVSPRKQAQAKVAILQASIREASLAELQERDARADEGIHPDLKTEVNDLLAEVWSHSKGDSSS